MHHARLNHSRGPGNLLTLELSLWVRVNVLTEQTSEELNDAQAVSAVCNGDVDRYRELIDRYERKVFAIAWSRLGDRDLAEEATQETFVRAFRHLGFLKKGGRFAAWIASISRNVAINLGIRRRHELEKRRRWALETSESQGGNEEGGHLAMETLRESLAKLPVVHREALVLFYLEGKSVSESAASLNISETAFKTRLHRGRSALREQLESQLESSLAELRPSRAIAPLVMAALGVTSAQAVTVAAGASFAAKASAGFLKFVPFPLIMGGVWMLGAIPGLLLGYWIGRLEKQNFRDQHGFRARIYQYHLVRTLLFVPVFMALFFFLAYWDQSVRGIRSFYQNVGIFFAVYLLVSARLLQLNRSRFVLFQYGGSALLTFGFLLLGLTSLPVSIFPLFMAGFFVLLFWCMPQRPLRMDYNLFLRAAHRMLPPPVSEHRGPSLHRAPFSATRNDLFAFARFLGERWLVNDYRSREGSLLLRMNHVRPRSMIGSWPLIWRKSSTIQLLRNGSAIAKLGLKDERNLRSLAAAPHVPATLLEQLVAESVAAAWAAFREGDPARAATLLGEQSEEAIFIQPAASSRGGVWGKRVILAAVVLQLILLAFIYRNASPGGPGAHLKPVAVYEPAVRATLQRLEQPRLSEPEAWSVVDYAHVMLMVLPHRELFTPKAWSNMVAEIWPPSAPARVEVQNLWHSPLLLKAVHGGLITMDDLQARGVDRNSLRTYLTNLSPGERRQFQELPQPRGAHRFYQTHEALYRLSLLARAGLIELVDSNQIVAQLRASQVLSAEALEQLNPNFEFKLVKGLFVNSPDDPLRDTWRALTILSLLGALQQIDKEACVDGILRFHLGRGRFGLAEPNPHFNFRGDAQDTWCAFESLRLLNALTKVRDLEKWEFRPLIRNPPEQPMNPLEIEAWVLRTRFLKEIER